MLYFNSEVDKVQVQCNISK